MTKAMQRKISRSAKSLLDDYVGKGHEPQSDDIDNASDDLAKEFGLDLEEARLFVEELC